MKIETKYEDAVLHHRYGGNDWAVVQNVDETHCRIVPVGKIDVGRRAFMAHKDMLSRQQEPVPGQPGKPQTFREQRLSPEALADLVSLRADIDNGTQKVVNSHIV